MKFLNTCRRHLDIFAADPKWDPSNPLLTISKLDTQLDEGYTIAADVPAKLAPQKILINQRQATYDKIKPFVRSSRRYLNSCGATEAEIADAASYIDNLLGTNGAPKPKDNPDTPANEALNSHSVSHLSYDSRYGNLVAYRAFLGNVSAYQPNEDPITLASADALIAECAAANDAVSAGFVPLSNAWNLRDDKLYTGENSIYEVFRAAKEYYKSLYAPSSPQYRTITAREMTLKPRGRG
jgi:hypothetical protein